MIFPLLTHSTVHSYPCQTIRNIRLDSLNSCHAAGGLEAQATSLRSGASLPTRPACPKRLNGGSTVDQRWINGGSTHEETSILVHWGSVSQVALVLNNIYIYSIPSGYLT